MLGRLARPQTVTLSTISVLSSHNCKRLTTKTSQFRAAEPGATLERHRHWTVQSMLVHCKPAKAFDETVFPADKPSSTAEFFKSFGVLLEEPERAGVVGRYTCSVYCHDQGINAMHDYSYGICRWDWHLWQIFVMLLPPLGA